MAETPVIKAKNLEPSLVEIVKVAQVFNSFLVNYVAIFFVILDFFVYCLWPLYVNTNGGYFYGEKKIQTCYDQIQIINPHTLKQH